MQFDGGDIGLNSFNEDVNAAFFDTAGRLLFSALGTYTAGATAGESEDVSGFVGTLGTTTSGTTEVLLDLSAIGLYPSASVNGVSHSSN